MQAIDWILLGVSLHGRASADEPAEVVVLGVSHSGQLVSEASQPAALRAFIDRVDPAAICIEREPEAYARGDFYEFTYEQQEIVIPYARERGIPIHPIDWEPDGEDMKLALGEDLREAPLLRPARGYLSFVSFPHPSALGIELLAADGPDFNLDGRRWIETPNAKPRDDFHRRLFLYRTFLQSMRIAQVAKRYPGQRVLVVIGWMHKPDVEGVLGGEPGIRLLAPSTIGAPTPEQVNAAIQVKDLEDIATFNLLGVQGSTGNVNWKWIRSVLDELRRRQPTAPTLELFEIRLAVLTGGVAAEAAVDRYERAAADVSKNGEKDAAVAWTGRTDARRLDSYFDPFAGLTLLQRLLLERARELGKLERVGEAARVREDLAGELSESQANQLRAYWDEFVTTRK